MSNPPTLEITISQAQAYVEKREGREVSRATLYNWINAGRKGQRLRVIKKVGQFMTRKSWVDNFLDAL